MRVKIRKDHHGQLLQFLRKLGINSSFVYVYKPIDVLGMFEVEEL